MPEIFVYLTCFCVGLKNQWCTWTGINCLRHIYYWISKNTSTYCRVRDRLIYTRKKQNNHLMWKPKMCNYNSFYSKFVFKLFKFSGCWEKKKHIVESTVFLFDWCVEYYLNIEDMERRLPFQQTFLTVNIFIKHLYSHVISITSPREFSDSCGIYKRCNTFCKNNLTTCIIV